VHRITHRPIICDSDKLYESDLVERSNGTAHSVQPDPDTKDVNRDGSNRKQNPATIARFASANQQP